MSDSILDDMHSNVDHFRHLRYEGVLGKTWLFGAISLHTIENIHIVINRYIFLKVVNIFVYVEVSMLIGKACSVVFLVTSTTEKLKVFQKTDVKNPTRILNIPT